MCYQDTSTVRRFRTETGCCATENKGGVNKISLHGVSDEQARLYFYLRYFLNYRILKKFADVKTVFGKDFTFQNFQIG